jgi:hypothetical protein
MAKWHFDAARLNTKVRQGRALERHYHWIFVLVLMRGYAEEEQWPDMGNGHVLGSA